MLPYAHGAPAVRGRIKTEPDDFVVEEILGFQPCGEGEHVFVLIEKCGENTDFVARQLARFAQLPTHAVSYAGMKDRHGRTTQWFSLHLPGKHELDWHAFTSSSIAVRQSIRHNRKLKKGVLAGNRFEITVHYLEGDRNEIEGKLHRLAEEGFPNFFGKQRFGHNGQNIAQAQALFTGQLKIRDRHVKGLYLSAARALIFNQVLAKRVAEGNWNRAVTGDVFMFSDSHSFFKDALTPDIERRIHAQEIHPSGPLWGKGESAASDQALAIEITTAAAHSVLCEGLARAGMDMARRPLRLSVRDLQWDFPITGSLRLRFSLPAGAYATAVLREVVQFDDAIE